MPTPKHIKIPFALAPTVFMCIVERHHTSLRQAQGKLSSAVAVSGSYDGM